jgi:integrase
MGSVVNRGPNVWLLKWELERSAEGRRQYGYRTVHGTKTDAKQELAKIESDRRNRKRSNYQSSRESLAFWSERFFEHLTLEQEGVSAKTLEGYRQWARVHILPALGGRPLLDINREDVNCFLAQLDKRDGLKPASVKHARRVLKMIFDFAIDSKDSGLKTNPAYLASRRNGGRKRKHAASKRVKALDETQLAALLNFFWEREPHYYDAVCFSAYTGCRQGEQLALRWKDLNFERGEANISRSVESLNRSYSITATKTGEGRVVGLSPALLTLLKRRHVKYLEDHRALGSYPAEEDLVFPRSPAEPLTPMSRHNLSRAVSRAAKALGLQGYTWHCLRHTWATQQLADGTQLKVVSYLLGHSTEATTLQIYSHYLPNTGLAAVSSTAKRLDQLIKEL